MYIIYILTQYLNNISNYLDKFYGVKLLSTYEDEEEYEKNHENICFFVSISFARSNFNEDDLLDSKKFIEFQTYNLTDDCQVYKYTCIETWFAREMYIKKHKVQRPPLWVFEPESDDISKALTLKFRELMPQAYYISSYLDTHRIIAKSDFKRFNIFILVSYLICWIYILIISLHTLNIQELLRVIKLIQPQDYPFLDIFIENITDTKENAINNIKTTNEHK